MDHNFGHTAVVLCAGGSSRMGRDKGLLLLGGRPLLVVHIEALRAVSKRVVVALGCRAEAHRAVIDATCEVVVNPSWETTHPADTLRLALRDADVVGPCWVTPVDVPPASRTTLDALRAQGPPAVPVDPAGRPGHPVLLDAARVASVRRAAPDGGLRTLLRSVPAVPVPETVAVDFDDPEAWARFVRERGRG